MSDVVAYLPAYTDPDCWGSIYVDDAEDFDLRAAVAASLEPNRTFVVSDPAVISSLDRYATAYATLARTAVPGG